MARLLVGLRSVLLADGPVAALVGTRIYPRRLPENSTMPALTYQFVTGEDVLSHSGRSGLERNLVQFNAWAQTLDAAEMLSLAVVKALVGFQGSAGGLDVQSIESTRKGDLFDMDGRYFGRSIDLEIWNEEQS